MTFFTSDARAVVIDTEQYAGNFEREMCAYLTAQWGQCGVGGATATAVANEIRHANWWKDNILKPSDEKGCKRPVSIYPTPGWFSNGMGGHYRDDPAFYDEARHAAVQAMKDYNARQNDMCRHRLASGDFEADTGRGWTKEACERTLASNEAAVRRVEESQTRYPAALSVAIYVKDFPPSPVLEEFLIRATAFASDSDNPIIRDAKRWFFKDPVIRITGIRFVYPVLSEDRTIIKL